MSMIQVQGNVQFDSDAHVLHYGGKALPVDYTHFGNVETIRTQPLAGVVKRMAKAMGIVKLGYPVVMLQGLKGITMDHFVAIDAELFCKCADGLLRDAACYDVLHQAFRVIDLTVIFFDNDRFHSIVINPDLFF